MTKRQIHGFEFLVQHPDGTRVWERLHGAGGFIGDGTLYQFADGSIPTRLHCSALLSHARRWTAQRERDGDGIRVLRDPDAPPSQRFATLRGATVHACRPLGVPLDLERTARALERFDQSVSALDAGAVEWTAPQIYAALTDVQDRIADLGGAFAADTADRNDPDTCRALPRSVAGLAFIRRMVRDWRKKRERRGDFSARH